MGRPLPPRRVDAPPVARAATPSRHGFGRLIDRAKPIVATVLPTGAVVLAILTFGGYAMGLVRDKMLAHTFGAGPELDAYNAAFVPAELALDVLVAGGLVAPFVPLFLGLKGEAEKAARDFGRTVFTLAVAVMTIAAAILFVVAPTVADVFVPDYAGSQRDLYIGLFRLMLCTPVIFAASLVLGEVLVAERRFVTYGLAGLMYSGGIAAGAFLLGAPDRLGIYGAAVGAIAGALAHLGIRAVGIYRTGFRPRPSLRLRTKGLPEFLRLMAPKMVSQPIEPLTFAYFTRLASGMAYGSVTAYNFGRNFQGMPVSLFGLAFALAAFPALSVAATAGDRRGFRRIFLTNLVTIGVLSTAAAIGLFVLGGFLIRVFLGGGAFDAEDVRQTSMVLAIFTLSIPLESVSHLLARALYATRNTLLPTLAAVAGFAATVIVAERLAPGLQLAAVPLAYFVGMAVRVVLLAAALWIRAGAIGRTATRPATIREGRPVRAIAARPAIRPSTVAAALLSLAVLASVAYAGSNTFSVVFAAQPTTTPWARERPVAVRSVAPIPTAQPTATPYDWTSGPAPAATVPGVTGSFGPPGPFAMDLYQKGDFVGEQEDTWCVPAAMQTSMNVMDDGADTSYATQKKLFDLAVAVAGSRANGAEPQGWAIGLTKLGYGNYEVATETNMEAAVKRVVKQIRLTNRPAGLIVWYGWHSWVISGFSSDFDPAYTDDYTVTALNVEDVWYPRKSTLWNKSRRGMSRPPDSLVPYGALAEDYLPFKQGYSYPDMQGRYVFVIPTD